MINQDDNKDLDDICEECQTADESVTQNLILTGFKLCKHCRTSKTIFPLQLIVPIGTASILVITYDRDKITIIKNDKNTIPNDLKLDFKLSICFVETIKPANIQN